MNLTGGTTTTTGCSGYIAPVSRLGFPGLCLSDAGNGLRSTDYVTSWAAGWSAGASWNRELTHQRAMGIGQEYRKKGSNVILGPVVGPVGRIAADGRTWEGFATDPYLSGQLAYETVVGVQSQGIITSVKVSRDGISQGLGDPCSTSIETNRMHSTSLGTSRRQTGTPTETSLLFHRISMTRLFMSCTSGKPPQVSSKVITANISH